MRRKGLLVEVVQAVLITVVSIFLVVATLYLLTVIWLRRRMAAQRAEWDAAGLRIRRGPVLANYRGRRSERVPMRGNGALVLTQHDVRLVRFVPRREFVIPLRAVQSVSLHRGWAGSYRPGVPVLVIAYRAAADDDQAADPDGASEDALGVSVRTSEEWSQAIARAANVAFDPALQ